MLSLLKQIRRAGWLSEPAPAPDPTSPEDDLHADIWRIFGRALSIRHVDAGSCNGCELEIQALNNPYYNLEGLGIRFVASPRHADVLLVTGPVSRNMTEALQRTYEAMPDPKRVIAVGDCGVCGGVFGRSYATIGRVAEVVPVSIAIPGCPPTPVALLKGILSVARAAEAGRSTA